MASPARIPTLLAEYDPRPVVPSRCTPHHSLTNHTSYHLASAAPIDAAVADLIKNLLRDQSYPTHSGVAIADL